MVWGEYLLTRDGFQAIRDNIGEITLGFNPNSAGYDEATVGGGGTRGWASHVRSAAGGNEQPIAAIGWYLNSRTTPAQREAFIITHTTTRTGVGTAIAPFPEYSGFFMREIDDGKADTWNTFEFLEDVATLTDDLDSPPRWSTDEVIDWALYTRDIPGFDTGPPNVGGEPYVIWCARDPGIGGTATTTAGGGRPCIYPAPNSDTNFTNMTVICWRLDIDAQVTGVRQDQDVRTGIHARSLTVFDARAMYLSTVENLDPTLPAGSATQHPRRVRWSAIGHPFILDPGYENDAGVIFGVGAGFMDLDEFQGEGVAVEVMGRTAVAVYYDDGVAFLRRTGRPEEAFEREIISRKRGLLATRAIANVGEGLHFGIFTDGWFFLNESGEWTEVGRAQGQKQNQSIYKWKETFYNQLLRNAVHKITVAYDPNRKMVQVCWPSADDPTPSELNTVWYYDVTSDRVYEDTYVEDYVSDMTPRAWGVTPPQIHEPTSGPGSAPLGQFVVRDTFNAQAHERVVVHGDALGKVYVQDVTIPQYDSQNIRWDFELTDTAFGLDPFVMKTLDRIWIEYEVQPNTFYDDGDPVIVGEACRQITIRVTPDGGTELAVLVNLQDAAWNAERGTGDVEPGDINIVSQAFGRLVAAGHRFLIEFEGQGNIKILSIRIQVIVDEERGIGSHAKTSGGVDTS
jgi:hypothetical protein